MQRLGMKKPNAMRFAHNEALALGIRLALDNHAPERKGFIMASQSSNETQAASGWLLVAILVGAYIISFVDRQILSLLVQDLRTDLAITDTQIGLLQGPAFGVFYAVMGMPFGWLADRTHRLRLIASGLLLWTLMTMLGGLADSFTWLFITRMGVGVGEAALVPAAVSLLADCFAPNKRALPLSIFTAGASAGAGLALVLGSALIAFANGGVSGFPLIGVWLDGRATWQIVLILAGLAGIPFAVLILFLPEPHRRDEAARHDDIPNAGLVAYLGQHRRLFLPLFAGSSLLYIFANALSAWLPSMFERTFGWQPAMVGLRLGLLILSGAIIGNILSGVIATALVKGERPNGTLLTMSLGAALLAPVAIAGLLAPNVSLAQMAVPAIYFAIALCFGVATATFVAVTPARLRGQMVALYLLLGNLFGLGLGPPSIGLVLERILVDPVRVGPALAIVAALTVVTGAILLRIALRPHSLLAETLEDH